MNFILVVISEPKIDSFCDVHSVNFYNWKKSVSWDFRFDSKTSDEIQPKMFIKGSPVCNF